MAFSYSLKQRLRRQSHSRRLLELMVTLIILTSIFVLAWWAWQRASRSDDTTSATASVIESSVFEPEVETFTTTYFTFQMPAGWRFVATESTRDRYVYRGYNSVLVEQDLIIQVNPRGAPEKMSRVQPVHVRGDRLEAAGPISSHCNTKLPKTVRQPRVVELDKVRMLCDADGTIYSVLIGESGGDGTIKLSSSSNDPTTYTFIYRDLTARPVGRDIGWFIRTFKTK